MYDTEDGPKITPLGRYQLMNGLRKFDLSYNGNPDLQPIRSFEIPMMVRMCHGVSSYVNDVFGSDIQAYCDKPGFVGRVAQQLFPAPRMPENISSSPVSRKQASAHDKPRLSLRWVATYQNLGYLLALYVFLYMWLGVGFVGFILIVVLLMLFYAIAKASFANPSKAKGL